MARIGKRPGFHQLVQNEVVDHSWCDTRKFPSSLSGVKSRGLISIRLNPDDICHLPASTQPSPLQADLEHLGRVHSSAHFPRVDLRLLGGDDYQEVVH